MKKQSLEDLARIQNKLYKEWREWCKEQRKTGNYFAYTSSPLYNKWCVAYRKLMNAIKKIK